MRTTIAPARKAHRGSALMIDSPWEMAWMAVYTALEDFAAREGHADVPARHREDGVGLGPWIVHQRLAHSRGRLSADRAAKLEAVPGWTWSPHETRWEAGCAALEAFAKREGHTAVPRKHVESGVKLSDWVRTQRVARNTMPADRAARLEALPGWAWGVYQASWDRGFEALAAYADRTGTAMVANRHIEADGFDLGSWVAHQRRSHRRGALKADRVAALETLPGWVWEAPKTARHGSALSEAEPVRPGLGWAEGPSPRTVSDAVDCSVFGERARPFVEALNTYVKREGHANVPARHLEGPVKLGPWVHGRRVDLKSGRLAPERVAALESLPGWTWKGQLGPRGPRRTS